MTDKALDLSRNEQGQAILLHLSRCPLSHGETIAGLSAMFLCAGDTIAELRKAGLVAPVLERYVFGAGIQPVNPVEWQATRDGTRTVLAAFRKADPRCWPGSTLRGKRDIGECLWLKAHPEDEAWYTPTGCREIRKASGELLGLIDPNRFNEARARWPGPRPPNVSALATCPNEHTYPCTKPSPPDETLSGIQEGVACPTCSEEPEWIQHGNVITDVAVARAFDSEWRPVYERFRSAGLSAVTPATVAP